MEFELTTEQYFKLFDTFSGVGTPSKEIEKMSDDELLNELLS